MLISVSSTSNSVMPDVVRKMFQGISAFKYHRASRHRDKFNKSYARKNMLPMLRPFSEKSQILSNLTYSCLLTIFGQVGHKFEDYGHNFFPPERIWLSSLSVFKIFCPISKFSYR
jgi:hypothetical protein